jgi:hypothetical protein
MFVVLRDAFSMAEAQRVAVSTCHAYLEPPLSPTDARQWAQRLCGERGGNCIVWPVRAADFLGARYASPAGCDSGVRFRGPW